MINNNQSKVYTYLDALEKAKTYCAYQERAQQEVRDKLYAFGLHSLEVENAISELIGQNFLNEERFAQMYVRGKYKIKKWGRNKIKQGLKQKRVSEFCIKKGFKEVDLEEYFEILKSVLVIKMKTVKGKSDFEKNYKIKQYAANRGFEFDLIDEAIKDINGKI